MNDVIQPWMFDTALTLLLGIVAFMLNIYRLKVDEIEKKHTEFVTREELQQSMENMRSDRQRMHDENLDSLSGIRTDIGRVHNRIDQLFINNGK